MHKLFKSRVAAVATGAMVVVGLGTTGAAAAGLVGSDDIRNNSIRSEDINNNSLQSEDIQGNAIGALELAPNSVSTSALQNGAVELPNLSDRTRNQLDESAAIAQLRDRVGAVASELASGYAGANWSVVDRNVIGGGLAELRPGPSSNTFGTGPVVPPFGVGSLGVHTGSTNDKAAFGNQVDFDGHLVSDLTSLGFSVYTTNENNDQGNNMPSITFEIDPNLTSSTSGYSSMVYTPANGAAGQWTTFDATDDAQGAVWGLTGSAGSETGCALSGSRCTWSQLQDALDDGDGNPATIYTVQITKGRDYAFSGAVDGLTINGKVFDFEPDGVQVQPAQAAQ